MSQENVEIIKAAMDALNQRDIAAVVDTFSTDAVIHEDPETAPDAADFHGHVGVEEFFRIMFEAWEELAIRDVDIVEADRKLVVTCRVRARGIGSQVSVGTDYVCVYEMRAGKISRVDVYFDRAEALQAVGLQE